VHTTWSNIFSAAGTSDSNSRHTALPINVFVYKCFGLQVSSPARRPIPRVDDQSSFGSLYTSPLALGRSGWPGCATDKNSWLRSTKLFSRWSISVEQSATRN